MIYRTLGKTGLRVSVLGFGASPLGGVFRPIDESDGIRAVHAALDLGINYFDVAPYYGDTRAETALGRALAGIPRESYYVATKVGRYGADRFDFSATRVRASIEESLSRLGVEHVDVIQCHDIEFGSLDQVVNETLPALREAQAAGKARFVGITGYPLKIFTEIIPRAELDTIISYCRYTLLDTALESLLPLLAERKIGVINAAPLAMGLLTQAGPPAWHPGGAEVREAASRAAKLCATRGHDIAELALQFAVAGESIATTLVGMASEEEVRRNLAAIEAPLDAGLLIELGRALRRVVGQTWPSGRPENRDAV